MSSASLPPKSADFGLILAVVDKPPDGDQHRFDNRIAEAASCRWRLC
jgi:hypothetical protein